MESGYALGAGAVKSGLAEQRGELLVSDCLSTCGDILRRKQRINQVEKNALSRRRE